MVSTELFFKIGLILLGIGAITFFIGMYVLVSRVLGVGINKIAEETKKIVQKGIAEEMAGLVGNASVLIESLNQLVQTSTGIGVFLVVVGSIVMGCSIYLLIQFA
ncbi:MAG: hypothetical protein CVU46_17465 [Chloroflexi bacterium HGW-Chloroflexi-8]|nr:MAG: hypothetical protein CVU46_17465 [Chloroflexi bacterium HGW-Chloroflexi-8]